MKKIYIIILLAVFAVNAQSQQLAQVGLIAGSDFKFFAISASQDVLIRIGSDGSLLEWGEERQVSQYNYTSPTLMPFMGRVDYYGQEAFAGLSGKLKSLGTSNINWYTDLDMEHQAGKLKSVGNLKLDYYTNFEDKAYAGKLKKIGNLAITYYSSFDNEAIAGKIKSIGNTSLLYYTSFDDRLIAGKIKSIGPSTWQWYGSRDSREYMGGLKAGSNRQYVNGITYNVLL